MKLRHLLIAGLAMAALLIGVRLMVLASSIRDEQRVEELQEGVDRVSRDAAALLTLSHDFLLHAGPRALRQWQAAQQAVARDLPLLAAAGGELGGAAARLQPVVDGLPGLFQGLRDAQGPAGPARREFLADALLAETRRLSEGAFEMGRELTELRRKRAVADRNVTIAAMACFGLLTLGMSLIVRRRVLEPISALETAARALNSGDAGARTGYRRKNDELGHLAATFDEMAQTLQQRAAQLDQGERFLRKVTDGLPMRIAYLDRELRYRFVNQARSEALGLPREAILGATQRELRGEQVDEHVQMRQKAALDGQAQRFEFEEVIVGETRCFDARLLPDRDGHGQVLGLLAVGTDITERKRAEAELRAATSLLQSVLAAATQVAIVATRPDGTITVFNAGAERMLGWQADELVGLTTPALLHDEAELAACAAELAQVHGHEIAPRDVLTDPLLQGQAREWALVRRDGTRLQVSMVTTAMRADDGQLLGWLGVAHDITRQREHERSLRDAMQQARQANQAKSDFLANMSHEIRTPLNAVIGLGYLLQQTPLTREQAAFAEKIGLAGRTLLALVNDILDLSKIEAGELQIEAAPFRLQHLLKEVADVAALQAGAKGIAFELHAAGDLPERLAGDATRLAQVLTNLLNNAIKFTERGAVVLEAGVDGRDDSAATLRFTVRDSGIGIDPAVQQRLFMPFIQADASTTRRFGGTGLGLSIVKRLLDAMGGHVSLRSQAGAGSEFTVLLRLPLAGPAPVLLPDGHASGPAGDERALPGVRVLVVDDSAINLEVARRILELEGARVTTAEQGRAAVERLAAEPEAFDIVLMDVQMPVEDGYSATRRIRAELGLAALPILALSAAALSGEREEARSAGMNGYISKPFEPKALVRAVRSRVPASALRPAEALPPPLPAPGGDWPEIEGIAKPEVRERLGGDRALFFTMLSNLLGEFVPLAVPATACADWPAWAARMHRLRGSAGLLSAHAVQALAGDCEVCCRAGDGQQALPLLHALADELACLERHARPVLQAAEAAASAVVGGELDGAALRLLLSHLRAQDLAAIDGFARLAPALRARLDAGAFADLQRAMNTLRFADAARLLEEPATA